MVVLDTSALTPFLRIGEFSLFKKLWKKASVSSGVYSEVEEFKAGSLEFIQATREWVSVRTLDQNKVLALSTKEGLTLVDAEVLLLALKEDRVLVSGDRTLIQAAKAYGIKVFWTTEVLLEALKQKKVSKKDALRLLDELIKNGLRIRIDVYSALRRTIENYGLQNQVF